MTRARPRHPRVRRLRGAGLTTLLAALAMIGPFATDSYLPALPHVARAFGVGDESAQITLSAYLMGYAAMTLLYGTLSDAFGRRPVIVGGLAIFTLASAGAAASPSFGALLAWRVLQGLSAGAGIVVGQAIVRDRFRGAAVQRMLSNIMMVFALAPAAAPVVGGQLDAHWSWRSIFALLALFAAALLAACLRWLPESLAPEHRQPWRPRALARHYASALRHRRFVLGIVANGCAFGGFALYISCAANFVMHVLHRPATAFAWLFVPMIAGVMLGSAASARLATRAGAAASVRVGLGTAWLAALINLASNAHGAAALPWAVVPIGVYAFGMGIAMPGMSAITQAHLPHARGLAASLQSFVQMALFACIAAAAPHFVFDSAWRMALAHAGAVTLGALCWWRAVAPASMAAATPANAPDPRGHQAAIRPQTRSRPEI
ncbi:multidrug effflux MFS transporter [Paraburkholderia sp. J94]|uniref:multidrug effflux MFS transporter n=1 Tax=Paraburkholderia sp. J94 TaxID=2805441 RepID=UPI002AB135B3|nr:multidrug effflux MFS transporter [Paraburkholderia sp. J94]